MITSYSDIEINLIKSDAIVASGMIKSALHAIECDEPMAKVKMYLDLAQQLLTQLKNTKF